MKLVLCQNLILRFCIFLKLFVLSRWSKLAASQVCVGVKFRELCHRRARWHSSIEKLKTLHRKCEERGLLIRVQ